MSHAMLKDRNGPSKVAEQRANIDTTFKNVSDQLYRFHKSIIDSAGHYRIEITPAHKIKLYDQFYKVANTHPSVAKEFVRKLEEWSTTTLVPEYKKQLDKALATGDEDTIFHAVSQNFQCFTIVTKVTATIFHNVNNQLADSPGAGKIAAPKQVLFNAYRINFYDIIRPKMQAIFFKRVSDVRRDGDMSKLTDLRPCAEIFMHVARSSSGTLDEAAANTYQRDYVDTYLKRLVEDNRVAVKQQQAQGIAANDIAKWIVSRADFEEILLQALVAPENNLHRAIMSRYDDDVVATCTVDLVQDKTHGFASSFQRGDRSLASFASAIDLFEISARVERKHPRCVRECVSQFKVGSQDRLLRLIQEARQPVYDSTSSHADQFVKQVLEEYHIMEVIIKKMRSHVDLQRANTDSFKQALNSDDTEWQVIRKVKRGASVDEKRATFPELLATFVDGFLKEEASNSSVGDGSRDRVRDIGVLFSFVSDKDIFGEHYKLRLAKRLLLTKFSEDLELQVLEQMQRVSGKHFIHKFEGMINDLRTAENLQRQFAQSPMKPPCEFEVKVLTHAFWPPIKPDDQFVQPTVLVQCQGVFERFYQKSNATKTLRWQDERGSASLDVAFPKGVKEIAMNLHQAAALIMIDTIAPPSSGAGAKLTVLAQRTGIDISELKPIVASMIFAKGLNIVRRVGLAANAKLEEDNCLEINPDFMVRMKKLKLPTAITARSQASETVSEEQIDASRQAVIDAAIVKLMKSRKTLPFSELTELVLPVIARTFKASVRNLKGRIEILIQKAFLKRDENDSATLHYLA